MLPADEKGRREEIMGYAAIKQPPQEDGSVLLADSSDVARLVAIMQEAFVFKKSVLEIGLPGKRGRSFSNDLRANRMIAMKWITQDITVDSFKDLPYALVHYLCERWGGEGGYKANSVGLYEILMFRDCWLETYQAKMEQMQ